jgi:hypothetical protein
LPGEQKEVTAIYDPANLNGRDAVLAIDGYNVAGQSAEIK